MTGIREKKKVSISRRHEIRFLVLLTVGLCVPTLGTFIAIFSTAEPDISDLTPISEKIGEDLILNWADIERRPHALHEASSVFAGASVQALGYMMENERPIRAGEPVQDFILLPGAGNLLHPAHRFGDQMIAVHLPAGQLSPVHAAKAGMGRGHLPSLIRRSHREPASIRSGAGPSGTRKQELRSIGISDDGGDCRPLQHPVRPGNVVGTP